MLRESLSVCVELLGITQLRRRPPAEFLHAQQVCYQYPQFANKPHPEPGFLSGASGEEPQDPERAGRMRTAPLLLGHLRLFRVLLHTDGEQ
jgi:hypothetical protein